MDAPYRAAPALLGDQRRYECPPLAWTDPAISTGPVGNAIGAGRRAERLSTRVLKNR